jgi:Zn-finger nucleic acid-binding protein
METHPYAGPGAVVIDFCRHCEVVWIDRGELLQIQQAPGRK